MHKAASVSDYEHGFSPVASQLLASASARKYLVECIAENTLSGVRQCEMHQHFGLHFTGPFSVVAKPMLKAHSLPSHKAGLVLAIGVAVIVGPAQLETCQSPWDCLGIC